MPLYRYEATDRSGKIMRGVMNAQDETVVTARLGNMGYAVRSVTPAQASQQPATATAAQTQLPQQRQSAPMFPASVEPVVKLIVLARYYRQLAVLVRSGMHLAQSLAELSDATKNTKLRHATDAMQSQVQAGASLSSAMAGYPLLFPVHTVGLIWAGEQGGYLDVALEEAASEIEQELKDNRIAGIGWFVAKLNIIGIILVLPVWDVEAFMTKVSGGMMQGASDNPLGSVNVGAAAKTVATAYVSGFIKLSIPAIILWIVLSYVWGLLKRNPNIRRSIDSALLAVPNWGKFHASRSRERFLKTLKKQYDAGVSPAQSWAAASMTVRNSEYARRLRGLESIMRQPNGSLRDALVQSKVFSIEDSNMVGSGEKAGSVPEMLERLADHHGGVVNSSRTFGRVIATHALLLFMIIPTGVLFLKMVAAFFSVGAKFGGLTP